MERSKFILKVALVLWIVSLSAQAQTNGRYSYNKSRIYQSETTWLDHVEYDNGLGEVCQQIDLGITPRKKDLVTLTEYDDHRRVEKVWLPAAMSTNGEFMKYAAAIRKASIELNSNDSHPYTAYTYEASNKGRVKTEQPPGGDWATNAKDKKYDYKNCIASGVSDVLYFVDFMGCLMRYPTYREGLSCKETIDEDGHICREYFDSDNQKLLTRRVSGNKTLSTYLYIKIVQN